MREESGALRTIDATLVEDLTGLVARAAAAILAIAPAALDTRLKADKSPVTAADEAADAVIARGLARLLPGIPVVSEESRERPTALGETFVLVDPLDGTKEIVAGVGEYTVNLASVTGDLSALRRVSSAAGAMARIAAAAFATRSVSASTSGASMVRRTWDC